MAIHNSVKHINKYLKLCIDCFDKTGIDSVREFTHNISILVGWINSLQTEVRYFPFDNESDKEKVTSFAEKASSISDILFKDILVLLPLLLIESNTLLLEEVVKR